MPYDSLPAISPSLGEPDTHQQPVCVDAPVIDLLERISLQSDRVPQILPWAFGAALFAHCDDKDSPWQPDDHIEQVHIVETGLAVITHRTAGGQSQRSLLTF